MIARRACLLLGTVASTFLAILAGCSKPTSHGGITPLNDPPRTAEAIGSLNNLKQLGVGMHAHHDAFGHFPTPGRRDDQKKTASPATIAQLSWRVQLLPFIEQSDLYNLIQEHLQRTGRLLDSVAKTTIEMYAHPKLSPTPETNYRVFVGNGAAFDPVNPIRFADFVDGTSNTILIVEAAEAVNWTSPEELLYDPKGPLPKLGIFDGGFHALMADGSVRWIPSDTPEATIRAMITRGGGEKLTLPGKRVDAGSPIERAEGPIEIEVKSPEAKVEERRSP